MTWQIPLALGGPVLHWELLRGARQRWQRFLLVGYAGWLLLQFLALMVTFDPLEQVARPDRIWGGRRVSRLSPVEIEWARFFAHSTFLKDYFFLLLQQQLLLLLILIPLLTAGTLGREKERGTLTALFGTEMTAWQIITGKFLASLAGVYQIALVALSLLVFMAVLCEGGPLRLVLALAQAAVLAFALTAASALCAVWTRRTADAILGSYATMTVVYLANLSVLANTSIPHLLDPLVMLQRINNSWECPREFLAHLGIWFGLGLLCLVVAAVRLRPACLRQLEKRPSRWRSAIRPQVGDDSIRWREQYVLGLAPLAWLRGMPGWLALSGVFTFSALFAGSAIEANARGVMPALRAGDFARALWCWQYPSGSDTLVVEVSVMGGVLLLLSALAVGVRCGTSISEEKRRKTWEDLLLTACTPEEIVKSKRWGILQAMVPHLIVYSMPMFALASLGGLGVVLIASCWLNATGVASFITARKCLRVPEETETWLRQMRRFGPRPPLEGEFPFEDVSPVEGTDLIEKSGEEMTEKDVFDFLRK